MENIILICADLVPNFTKGKIYEGEYTATLYDPHTLRPVPPSYIIRNDKRHLQKCDTKNFMMLNECRNHQIEKVIGLDIKSSL